MLVLWLPSLTTPSPAQLLLLHPGLEHGSFQGSEFSLDNWFNYYVSSVYIIYMPIIPK